MGPQENGVLPSKPGDWIPRASGGPCQATVFARAHDDVADSGEMRALTARFEVFSCSTAQVLYT